MTCDDCIIECGIKDRSCVLNQSSCRLRITKQDLIDRGWTPPPEKKIFEGEFSHLMITSRNGLVYFLPRVDNEPIIDGTQEFLGKRVRITIEELR